MTDRQTTISDFDAIKKAGAQSYFSVAAENLLKGITALGMDTNVDANFKGTIARVAKTYVEILEGAVNTDAKIKKILAKTFPAGNYDEIVIAKNIITFGLCPHHLLPVKYTTTLGYLPNPECGVLGISKLTRLVKILSKRPVLQEQLTKEIVDSLASLKPLGVGVVVVGEHMCMQMRGVEQQSAITTSKMSGVFMTNLDTRSEFLRFVGV